MKISKFSYNKLYLFAIVFIAVALPLSKFLISIGIILIALIWLSEGDYIQKYRIASKSVLLIIFLIIYLVHVIWFFFSTDYKYGLQDLQMKLPLLIFPIIIATIEPPGFRQKKILLSFFILALLVCAVIGIFTLAGLGPKTVTDAREISLFISHIRLSLMVNLGIFCAGWMYINKEERLFRREKIALAGAIIVLSAFIFLLKSLTGIVVFILLSMFTLIWHAYQSKNKKVRVSLIIIIVSLPLMILGYSAYCFTKYYTRDKIDFSALDSRTSAGGSYFNDTQNTEIENGHYVWMYLCEDELRSVWNKKSNYYYDGKDKKGQYIKYTLIRYLTSKGLRKDSVGVCSLSAKDIGLIESGLANYIFGNKWKLYPYVYRVIWEIDEYSQGGNPAGHSVAQRWLYLHISKEIIQSHFWFGVGTGDVQKEFNKIYESRYKEIPEHWRRRAHNQFITFWISFGIIGLTIILVAFFIPVFSRIKMAGYPGYIFILIAILSMLNEDTLETHAGATFIAFFYSLFFMIKNPESK